MQSGKEQTCTEWFSMSVWYQRLQFSLRLPINHKGQLPVKITMHQILLISGHKHGLVNS